MNDIQLDDGVLDVQNVQEDINRFIKDGTIEPHKKSILLP